MNWLIPAKTFLLGEYTALAENSAILITTEPCFKLTLTQENDLLNIHPESPAGIWWLKQGFDKGLHWFDPYSNLGGLGASSAQFLAAYLASCFVQNKLPNLTHLLETYYQSSWTGKGLRPSGYDVIAQTQHGCIFINKRNKMIQIFGWPFHDLSFFIIHTGVKLATHHHLQNTALPPQTDYLSVLVDEAKQAFLESNSQQLISCVTLYHNQLVALNLVAEHSLHLINQYKEYPEVVAIKGCGALGSDTLLLLTLRTDALKFRKKLQKENRTVIATENSFDYTKAPSIHLDWYASNEFSS